MKLNILNSPDDAVINLAHYFVTLAEQSIATNGKFSVALSGGSSPKKLYELLASNDFKNKVDWENVYFFFFDDEPVHFDLVLLGLGDNSHTASLFPHTEILHDNSASVKEVFLDDQQIYRISFTSGLINNAQHIAFLVYGAGKAEAVHHVLEDNRNIEEYPAQLIFPTHGDVRWFLDTAAAADLKNK